MPAIRPRRLPDPSSFSDRRLLHRVLHSDERAWAELLRRYRALIYRCITKVTGRFAPRLGGTDIDEIYADVLFNLLRDDMRKLRMYRPSKGMRLSSWIGMISVNTAYDFLRGLGRRPLPAAYDGSGEIGDRAARSPLEELLDRERWGHLEGLLATFSERDRVFLRLYYGEGMEAADVADRMAISINTVYSKKHKIAAHLRERVREQVDSPVADLVAA